MNIADFPDDSETSDEDYAPDNGNPELPSEEESDGDYEEALPEAQESLGTRGSKRKKTNSRSKKKVKSTEDEPPKAIKKADVDDLWASFKQDTGFKTRAERRDTPNMAVDTPKQTDTLKTDRNEKVKVTQIFQFAGEDVKIEREVSKNSKDIKVLNVPSGSSAPKARGGLGSVLNQIGKKSKISTLEKSKLDWDQFKKEEKIEDELSAYGKSKDGYLERQDFLQRADMRRFEIEKNIRSSLKTNRMNNVN
ncbi:hypothetical protein PPYR_11087 [Photinus pyralis]|uniref:Craniofacial development protein 1 n=1 Tax=Photinus pyralis TaxID=7054 RepID=A0A5N4AIC1_PHOPY|nr:craniofacial development protein 1 [Photinus pyralis]KAB0797026.1 hypothetical protein PPYR_11087 [Photinus pyralis]